MLHDTGSFDQEPTVLDLYKSVTKDWSSLFKYIHALSDARRRAELDRALAAEVSVQAAEAARQEPALVTNFAWRSILVLLTTLIAQSFLEPSNRQPSLGASLYIFAFGFAVWAYVNDEWRLPALPAFKYTPETLIIRRLPIMLSIILAGCAFGSFGEGVFTPLNVTLWTASIACLFWGLWVKQPKWRHEVSPEERRKKILWSALVLGVFAITVFFRLYRIDNVPSEPFSDHAEKIQDIYDITQGQYKVFFPRNTGREAIQMYWTLLVAKVFGSGLTFLSLKLGTALLGILTLPYIYLLGKEFGNERVGLFALFLFGIAYWPNVISRIGLRFPLYPLFAAPAFFYLTRGLRTRNRNDFILSGFFLGLGLHGYSPFRIIPVLVVIAFIIYIFHIKTQEAGNYALGWLYIIVVTSLFVFVPLLRYWISHPAYFDERALSRLTGVSNIPGLSVELPGPAWQIFFSNLYHGLLVFNWDDGNIWVNSLPHRPGLDIVTGALFVIGVVLLIARYAKDRDWRDLLLLVSIPILLMPSILSLAFPVENPALNRAGGAAVAAILISAMALDGLVTGIGAAGGVSRKFIAYGLTCLLFASSAFQNYDLVFNQFDANYKIGAWNSSDMGRYISEFSAKYGQTDSVWIVPYPYWVDTRLPGVWAGVPNRDFALWPKDFAGTLDVPAPKMIIYRYDDLETENALKVLYPDGVLTRYTSPLVGKDFMILLIEK